MSDFENAHFVKHTFYIKTKTYINKMLYLQSNKAILQANFNIITQK